MKQPASIYPIDIASSTATGHAMELRGGAVQVQEADPIVSFLNALDIFGTGVFAFSGALTAGKKGMDVLGMMIIATITSVGGGTLRDLLTGAPIVFWMKHPIYLEICCITTLLTFGLWPMLEQNFGFQDSARPICFADALGLAAFAVLGTQKAAERGLAPSLWVVSGLMSATFGGIMRDVICGERPRVMYPHRTMYATGPAIGSLVYVQLIQHTNMAIPQVASISFLATFMVRLLSFNQPWRLPHWQEIKGKKGKSTSTYTALAWRK